MVKYDNWSKYFSKCLFRVQKTDQIVATINFIQNISQNIKCFKDCQYVLNIFEIFRTPIDTIKNYENLSIISQSCRKKK